MIDAMRRFHSALGLKYRFDRVLGWARLFGVSRALAERRRMQERKGRLVEVDVPGMRHPVVLRAGTADVSTFEHIFVWNDYDLDYSKPIRAIIDAGGNIGLAAVFFANRFPDARIISIEPEAANFQLLQQNVAPYPNIVPLQAALWSEDAHLGLSNPDARVDSYRFDSVSSNHVVQAFSMPSLLARFGLDHIDVLKIDIEGGESVVFASERQWMRQIGMFVIELHGAQAEEAFACATASLRARRWRHGENHIVAVNHA